MNYKNFLNFLLVEASKHLKESLILNRECTPAILSSLTIHMGSMFIAQDWRVLSASMIDIKNENISQRLVISPKDMLPAYVVLDICLFKQAEEWEKMIAHKENTKLINDSCNHLIVGIAEGNSLISEELTCEDTLILPPSESANRRILWHIYG